MTVAKILAIKGNHVETTHSLTTVQAASMHLAQKRIGAIIVVDLEGKLAGILSERDIVRALSKKGADALQDKVSAYMTAKVETTTPDMSIISVMEQMTRGHFRHMPVLRNGQLHGLISIGDVVKYRIAEFEHEHQAMREYIANA